MMGFLGGGTKIGSFFLPPDEEEEEKDRIAVKGSSRIVEALALMSKSKTDTTADLFIGALLPA